MDRVGIHLHQALFGYRDGHRLISASRQFDPSTEQVLLSLSDMSGPRMHNGFEEYLSGYSLPKQDTYAFMKSWYAPEMERPGCVWTHALFISNEDVTKIDDLKSLLNYFSHPSKVSPDFYTFPQYFNAHDMFTTTTAISVQEALSLVSCLYEDPENLVLIPADSAKQYEELILATWSQQWPALRTNFSFCTGSLSNRSTSGQIFDLQVIPKRLKRELERDDKRYLICDHPAPEIFEPIGNWQRITALDVANEVVTEFRKFIWKYADPSVPGRKIFKKLAEFWFEFFQHDNQNEAWDVTRAVALIYPAAESGKVLKSDIFGKSSSLNILDGPRKLSALAETTYWESFNADDLQLRNLAKELWQYKRSDAECILLKLLTLTPQTLVDEIVAGFLEGMTPQDACHFAEGKGGVLIGIVARNPLFANQTEFWNCNLPSNLLLDILDLLSGELAKSVSINDWLPALIRSERQELAEPLLQRFGREAVSAFLDIYNIDNLLLPWPPPSWISTLCSHQDFVLEWITKTNQYCPRLIALLTTVLESRNPQVNALGIPFWTVLVNNMNLVTEIPNADSAAFLLSIGLQSDNESATKLIILTFEIVYLAAASDNLSYRGWQMLKHDVPSLGWKRNWDKCERLRRALLLKFNRNHWPSEDFLRAIKDPIIFRSVLLTASDIPETLNYLQYAAKPDSLSYTQDLEYQLKIIRSSLRRDWRGNLKLDL